MPESTPYSRLAPILARMIAADHLNLRITIPDSADPAVSLFSNILQIRHMAAEMDPDQPVASVAALRVAFAEMAKAGEKGGQYNDVEILHDMLATALFYVATQTRELARLRRAVNASTPPF